MPDKLTILTHSKLPLTKTWKADGSIDAYGDGKYFRMRSAEVADLASLHALLAHLEGQPSSCVIRGAPVVPDLMAIRDPEDFKPGLVRKSYDYFDDQPLHAVCIDVDGYNPITEDPFECPEGSIHELVSCILPEPFRGVSYHWQLSSTHGHPSKRAQGLKVHLWFWLEKPLTSAQFKAWAQQSGCAAIDLALYQPVQPHYTAAPLFEGMDDPFPARHGLVHGPLGDEVELDIDAAVLTAVAERKGGTGQRLRDIASTDPVALLLAERGMIKSESREGFNIECPFVDEHTSASDETSTQYRLPHTGGKADGHFICLHAHCKGRTRSMFLARLGIDEVEDEFEVLAQAPAGAEKGDDAVVRKGVPEAKHLTTDQANAGRIVDRFSKRLIVVAGQWFAWTGTRWEQDDGEVYRCGCLLSKIIHTEADAWRAKNTDDESEMKANLAVAEALKKWAMRSEMKANIEAALGLAKKLLAISEDNINRNPWLLNCLNGTVDLRTGELRKHAPEDYITKLVPLEYDPACRSRAWDEIIGRVTLESGLTTRPLARFLQRWFGYCATASTREQVFVVHYGQGSNGKSTILDTVAEVLGDYAATAAPGLLVSLNKNGEHPTGVADLFGRRMVTAHESGEGGVLREDVVKQLTGGDKVKARFMRADFFEFDPTHKLQLLTNHKPSIKGSDNGIWRRVVLMPYMARFASAEEVAAGRAHYVKDTRTAERLGAELRGVLTWVVQGAREWAREGLQPPDSVLAASKDYQTEQDRVAQFLSECCELDRSAQSPLSDGMNGGVYQAYREWCADGGFFAMSKKRLVDELSRCVPNFAKNTVKHGARGERRRDVLLIQGVRLLEF